MNTRSQAQKTTAPTPYVPPVKTRLLQRRCACGESPGLSGECAECANNNGALQRNAGDQSASVAGFSQRHIPVMQPKLAVGGCNDPMEQEADRVAEQVLTAPAHSAVSAAAARIQRQTGQATGRADTVPASVDLVLANPGRPLDTRLRQDMEHRFGYDFSRVRVHSGGAAEQSARDVNAHAYTAGHNIVFGTGRYAPETHEGRRLVAHELTHVVQQSGSKGIRIGENNEKYGLSPIILLTAAPSGIVQRAPAKKTEADYQRLVKQGKWCRDSEKTGELHPGLQCYRQIPSRRGYPPGDQVCFSKVTGEFAEPSPDFISAVSGQKEDGTCDIPIGITDPPQPFTQRGRRALGHLAADIATEDPKLIGRPFGRFSGVAMGIALPKHGLASGLGSVAIPAILGFVAGELGARGLPLLSGLAREHGFLPTISLGVGSNAGLGLGVGLEKRDRPLPVVPVNTYLTFGFDSSLAVTDEPAASSTFLAKVGVRIDPGKQGGLFALGAVGVGLSAGRDVSGATSAELGTGIRATDFLDVQLVRETVSGGGGGDATYWLTLRLVAPQRVLTGHR